MRARPKDLARHARVRERSTGIRPSSYLVKISISLSVSTVRACACAFFGRELARKIRGRPRREYFAYRAPAKNAGRVALSRAIFRVPGRADNRGRLPDCGRENRIAERRAQRRGFRAALSRDIAKFVACKSRFTARPYRRGQSRFRALVPFDYTRECTILLLLFVACTAADSRLEPI